jgi:hypothetical protein
MSAPVTKAQKLAAVRVVGGLISKYGWLWESKLTGPADLEAKTATAVDGLTAKDRALLDAARAGTWTSTIDRLLGVTR